MPAATAPPLDRWLTRRAWRRDLLLGLLAGFLTALFAQRYLHHRGGIDSASRALGTVSGVAPGPVLRVKFDGLDAPADVTLLGLRFEEKQRDAARDWLTEHLAGQAVVVSFDRFASRRDSRGVLRGYVYLGGEMVNEQLIQRGLAHAERSGPAELSDWFARLELRAAKRNPAQ